MRPLLTGIAQSWLTVAAAVLSQLFTLLFIDVIGRVIRRWPGRSVPAQRQASDAAPPDGVKLAN
jgi:hypothetical protein